MSLDDDRFGAPLFWTPLPELALQLGLKPRHLALIWALSSHHRGVGQWLFPGQARLVELTGMSKDQLSRTATELIDQGLLDRRRLRTGHTEYCLDRLHQKLTVLATSEKQAVGGNAQATSEKQAAPHPENPTGADPKNPMSHVQTDVVEKDVLEEDLATHPSSQEDGRQDHQTFGRQATDATSSVSLGGGNYSNAQLLTAEQLAERWQVSKAQIYRLARDGRIPAVPIGRYYRFRLAAIEVWETSQEASADD